MVGDVALAESLEPALSAQGATIADWRHRTTNEPAATARIAAGARGRADALLLIAPPRSTPASLLAAPLLAGLPVGIVVARDLGGLDPWLSSLGRGAGRARAAATPEWAVLAEWDERYLVRARHFARALAAAAGERRLVRRWFADRLNGVDLSTRLDRGPRWINYFGHASPEGLAGYFGLTARHFVERCAARPSGVFWCWACRTLKRPRRGAPFGVQLVSAGRAAAFVGSIASVRTAPNARLAALAGRALRGMPRTVGDLMRRLDAAVSQSGDAELARTWRSYRLVGNPLEPL